MTDDIQYRGFDIAEVDTEARTIEGVLAPYGDTFNHFSGYQERYERGVFGEVKDTTLWYNHDNAENRSATPIGRVELEDREDGLWLKGQIDKTAKAEEVYTLLRSGTVKGLSASFVGLQSRDDNGVTVWTKAQLLDASVVPNPAYKAAAISRVRSADTNINKEVIQENNMENTVTNSTEVVELRSAVETLDRKVSSLSVANEDKIVVPQYRSMGEYVKAVAKGEVADAQYRAYTGMTSDVSVKHETFIANQIALVDRGRKVFNLFSKQALPADGNSVDYYVLDTNTLQVGLQAAEGENLPTGAVSFAQRTAPVKTYGGWASLSRQAVERAQIPALDTIYRGLTLAYGQATEGAVRAALASATGTNTATLAANTVVGWTDVIVDSALSIESDTGLNAEFVLVSGDVFKALAGMVDSTGRPLVNVNGDGANTIGNARIPGLTGSIFGLNLVVDADLADGTVWVANSEALTSFESPGAPFRLQDENIVNLTEQFSLYGYLAVAVTAPDALVKVTVA